MQIQELRNDDKVSSPGNQMRKQLMAIIALALWLFIIAIFMLLSNRIDLELFFILCFKTLIFTLTDNRRHFNNFRARANDDKNHLNLREDISVILAPV